MPTDYSVYAYMLQAIQDYYAVTGTIWSRMALSNASSAEINFALSQIKNNQLSIDKTQSGLILGYGYSDPMYLDKYTNPILDSIDSNTDVGKFSNDNSFSPRFNSTWAYDDSTDSYTVTGGAVKSATGTSLSTIADRVSLAVAGVNYGAKLGKFIDGAIYNTDPEFWDTHLPALNPDTWSGMAGESSLGKFFLRTLFDIDSDGSKAYLDERVLAQVYQMLRDLGYLSSQYPTEGQQMATGNVITPKYYRGKLGDLAINIFGMPLAPDQQRYANNDAVLCKTKNIGGETHLCIISKENLNLPNSLTIGREFVGYFDCSPSPLNNPWYGVYEPDFINGYVKGLGVTSGVSDVTNDLYSDLGSVITAIYLGDIDLSVKNIPNATQYPPDNITGTTNEQVLNQLKQQYPDLFADSIYEDVLQNDGTIKRINYVPVPWESQQTNPEVKPQEQTQPQTNPQANPQQDTKVNPQTMTNILNNPTVPSPTNTTPDTPITGTGESPAVPAVSGSGSALWSIYNPSQSQLDAFGAWLWSSNFVDQLKKLFNDPMAAIIGIHKVFVTPSTSGSANIKCGYIDSGVSAKVVSSQYVTVDCGTVSLSEYYGSVFDYAPYTYVRCFLPFIGIVSLDVADIMRSRINIKYKVDVLTGACIAEIKVKRDGYASILYTFSGSCIVSYPISAGSYTGIISSVLSIAGSVITGGIVGGTVSALHALPNAHTDIKVNGSFTGSAGAMGGKIPYLIVTRPITRMAQNIDKFSGLGSNYYMKIGDCIGYFKCEKVHISIVNAYQDELTEIENLLLNGCMMRHENLDMDYYEPQEMTVMTLNVDTNGIYEPPFGYVGFNPVNVNVQPILQSLNAIANGDYEPESGYAGFSQVHVDVDPTLETLTATENRTYTPSTGYEGFSEVTVNVPTSVSLTTKTITQNGVYNASSDNADGYSQVTVNVPSLEKYLDYVLPDTYQEVEYIEFYGNQYFQLPTYANAIQIFAKSVNTTDHSVSLAGYRASSTNNYDWILRSSYTGNDVVIWGRSYQFTGVIGTFKENGIESTSIFIVGGRPINVGRYYQNVDTNFTGKLYKFYVINPNTIGAINFVYYLVPCYRIADSVIGFYDVVNNVFYTNQGTGTFGKGPDV